MIRIHRRHSARPVTWSVAWAITASLTASLTVALSVSACRSSDGIGDVAAATSQMPQQTPTSQADDRASKPEASKRKRRGQRWGADYFPNIELINHHGQRVRFFDDLIADKVVVINFIFTRCKNSCPLETARLKKVADILGDRVGKDVFMYSISIDPKHDTPEVLAAYTKTFRTGPGWDFLTGDRQEIITLRKKLGLYIDEIQDDPIDHNLSLIIGNQRTGQWMKRSPFENPYFLATQIGGWLHNWKLPAVAGAGDSYANAPALRKLPLGERLFRGRCMPCHTIGQGDKHNLRMSEVGPDLLGVTKKREDAWLRRWLAEPDKMLEEKDPIATMLYMQYNQVAMPNLQLSDVDIDALIKYLDRESHRIQSAQ